MQNIHFAISILALCLAGAPPAPAQEILLTAERESSDGLVLGRIDLTAAARWGQKTPVAPETIQAVDAESGEKVAVQFIPDADFDASTRVTGMIVARWAKSGLARLKITLSTGEPTSGGPKATAAWSGQVTTPSYTVEHDPKHQGGLPWRFTFAGTGKTFDSIRWNNRLYHRQQGGYCVCDDPQPGIERVATGPICTVVRVSGRYVQRGQPPASHPTATYDWYYFSDRPQVYVCATLRQRDPFTWHEVHFLELNYPGGVMPLWAGGEPLEQGRFQSSMKSFSQAQWGVIHDGTNGVGMFQCGQALLHDGGTGTYLQAHGDTTWQDWSETRREFSAWLWIGSNPHPVEAVREVAQKSAGVGRWTVTVAAVHARVEAARGQLASGSDATRQRGWWRVQGARQLEAQGRLEEAVSVAEGKKPATWTTLEAGDLSLILERAPDGLRLLDLFDSARDQKFAPARPLPLFAVTLRRLNTNESVTLAADQGWKEVGISADASASLASNPGPLLLRWQTPTDARLGNLRVIARVVPETATASLRWALTVENPPAGWSVWRVVFPQVAVADLGRQACVFFPKGAGQVERGVWQRSFRYSGNYPGGWTTMPFMAAYDEALQTGLYVAAHDPWGSTKDLLVESKPLANAVVLAVEHPVPDMGTAGNRFELSGEAVWRLLRGDWFDASVVYRDWVRREAKWYPKLTAQGRTDTPSWMRELSVWAQSGTPPSQCVEEVSAFTKYLGPPAAVHWYNWHQIPFDNDYPHYFPPKPDFVDGVSSLQSSGTFVMPYINGRLWDTRDRGTNDFEFSRVARPAVTKDEKGEPYVESYGSKESDGSPVRLGVMCPSTALWQKQIGQTVLRLMNECGVKGVYIDQIAAAQPTLCFDKTHGHPLGGGHWWTEGYWQMLEAIRQAMPKDCMITTECNGEPFIRCFDGYLTWHWQYDGQVPAFPAVYGGAIQMFGRSYGGGATRDLALRMRAGQQLVFGEQLGWLAPTVVREKGNAEFFRQVVHLRRHLAPYFSAGEMARPPKLAGSVPIVRADWQWGGVDWVTTDAVLTGAWHQPNAKRLALVFVNVSTNEVTAQVNYDLRPYGLDGATTRLTTLSPEGPGQSSTTPATLRREVVFPPQSAVAWELQP